MKNTQLARILALRALHDPIVYEAYESENALFRQAQRNTDIDCVDLLKNQKKIYDDFVAKMQQNKFEKS